MWIPQETPWGLVLFYHAGSMDETQDTGHQPQRQLLPSSAEPFHMPNCLIFMDIFKIKKQPTITTTTKMKVMSLNRVSAERPIFFLLPPSQQVSSGQLATWPSDCGRALVVASSSALYLLVSISSFVQVRDHWDKQGPYWQRCCDVTSSRSGPSHIGLASRISGSLGLAGKGVV